MLPAATRYLVHNLVADAASNGESGGRFIDSRLVNPWGLGASATSPFWVCDGGHGSFDGVHGQCRQHHSFGNSQPHHAADGTGRGGAANGVCTGISGQHCASYHPSTFPVTAPGKGPGGGGLDLCDAGWAYSPLGQRSCCHSGVCREGQLGDRVTRARARHHACRANSMPLTSKLEGSMFSTLSSTRSLHQWLLYRSGHTSGFRAVQHPEPRRQTLCGLCQTGCLPAVGRFRPGQWLRRRLRCDRETAPIAGGGGRGQSVEFALGPGHRSATFGKFANDCWWGISAMA